MSWVEVDGSGWSWLELDGGGWSWVHGLVIPIIYHYILHQTSYCVVKL